MKRFLFWITATLLFAAVGHVSTVLFTQFNLRSEAITKITDKKPLNTLNLLASIGSKTMFIPLVSPDISYGYCSYDIGSRPVRVRVNLPSTYWSLAAYSKNGINFFTINDQQVKTEKLEIVFALEQQKNQLEEGTTIVIPPTRTGLFLFRTFVPNRSLIEEVQAQMKEASCTPL
jgi:uncharacterized membrane protein